MSPRETTPRPAGGAQDTRVSHPNCHSDQNAPARRRPTDKQKTVLEFVQRFIATVGYPPTLREIAEGLGGLARETIRRRVIALGHKGWLEIRLGVQRGLVLKTGPWAEPIEGVDVVLEEAGAGGVGHGEPARNEDT